MTWAQANDTGGAGRLYAGCVWTTAYGRLACYLRGRGHIGRGYPSWMRGICRGDEDPDRSGMRELHRFVVFGYIHLQEEKLQISGL